MDKGQFLVEAHLRTGRPVAELAVAHGIHRATLYKLLARYRAEGPAGLEPRSRRPHSSPARISDRYEDDILSIRKHLSDAGYDAGAATIAFHLAQRYEVVPSTSTIHRVLRARGFVVPEPHKRPRSSWRSFTAELPNECWQADVTHVAAAGGAAFEVLNIIDDHSRVCVASHAFVVTRAVDVARTIHKAAVTWGYPARLLTDNGLVFTAGHLGGDAGVVEGECLALGIATAHARPYHPQTCGKVERFHQTMKRHLRVQEPPETKRGLQGMLDRFVAYYNQTRPHRSVGRRPPIEAFNARERAYPRGPKIDTTGYRLRRDKVDRGGRVSLRYQGRLHHIGVGRAFVGWRVVLMVAGPEVRIISADGAPIRRLIIDPTKDYQPMP